MDSFVKEIGTLLKQHEVATPFLYLSEARILKALRRFSQHLPKAKLFYAMKANSDPGLLQYFADRDLNFDVASEGEIQQLVELGVRGERMFLSTPVKSAQSVAALFECNVHAFATDSIAEIEKVAKIARERSLKQLPAVFIRLKIESKNVEIDLNTKFGCSVAEAIQIVERAQSLGFDVEGICFHVGSQSTDSDNYFLGVRSAILVAKEAQRRFGVKISTINIGGGFCDEEGATRHGIDIEHFYSEIAKAAGEVEAAGFQLYAEPGRCLVADAGCAVSSVLGVNVRDHQNWAYLDDGIYGCYSLKLYEPREFPFIHLANPATRAFKKSLKETSWTLGGPTCDSLDIVAEAVTLPAGLSAGDILLTPSLGAYSLATACAFNGFKTPACHLVRQVGRRAVILNAGPKISKIAAA